VFFFVYVISSKGFLVVFFSDDQRLTNEDLPFYSLRFLYTV